MAQKLKTELSLIEWCDQQVKEGKELAIGWEGGGDSGWCYFEIDGKQVPDGKENDYIRGLLDAMYNQLDYGSWAGEFSANGRAVYDPNQKAFVGTDYYSEDETEVYSCDIDVRVPKKLWFDRMEISLESDDVDADAAFTVRNGFLTEEHNKFLEEFKEYFNEKVEEVVDKFIADDNTGDYRSIWQSWELERSEFSEDGEFLVYNIADINIGTCTTDDKDVFLELEYVNLDEDYEQE